MKTRMILATVFCACVVLNADEIKTLDGLEGGIAAAQNPVARGEKVYEDQKCRVCHSIADKGNKKGPLDNVGKKLSESDIRAWIVDAKGMTARSKAARKPEMKSYTLGNDDLDALVAYMQSLK